MTDPSIKRKLPLPQFIEHRYQRQFGKKMPDDVRSIEKKVAEKRAREKMAKNSNKDVKA